MPKPSRSKGQWFIISAVVISGALLAISFVFRGYFAADTSTVQLNDQSYYFYAINEGYSNVDTSNTDCATKQKGMEELHYFETQEMMNKGIALAMIYDVDCTANKVNKKLLLLQSDDMEVWEGQRPSVASLTRQAGNGQAILNSAVNYGFDVEADICNGFGGSLICSTRKIGVPSGAGTFSIGPVSSGNYVVLRSVVLAGTRQFIL